MHFPRNTQSRFRPDGESRAVALPWQACLRQFARPACRFQSAAWLVRLCSAMSGSIEQVRGRAVMLGVAQILGSLLLRL